MPIQFPSTIKAKQHDLRMVRSVAMTESPFTYDQQVYDFGGARWEMDIVFPRLTVDDARTLQAFLISLKGMYGTFYYGSEAWIQSVSQPTTTGSHTKGDETLNINTGFTLAAGSMFELENSLYMTTSAITSSDNTVDIQPPLRGGLSSSGQTFDLTTPRGLWRLASNTVNINTDEALQYGFTLSCVEAF